MLGVNSGTFPLACHLSLVYDAFGVTGYSLPRDQIGYWAVKIVRGVPEAIPVIGNVPGYPQRFNSLSPFSSFIIYSLQELNR